MTDALARLTAALADRYLIERELGQGGMATVYLAEDLRHERKVALKVLRPELAATLGPERFHREIKIAAQLQHPHILPLLDSGEAADLLFYVMPYVEGQSLRERLAREGALPVGDAVRILRDVVDALTEAHAHGVVHRDIKPENIMLRGHHALVTDFGVAKAVSEATGRQTLTTAGVALGTPAYMAPEQASADPHLDHRVDIYAVGAVGYELLTGRPVFMGTTPQMVLSAHVTEAPVPITRLRETVPKALEAVVMRCLEKRPGDRWQSAEELLAQLEALATPSGGITPTQTQPVTAVPARRRLVAAGVLGAVVVLVAAGAILSRLLTHKPLAITLSDIAPLTNEPGVEFQPALSPDGQEVAFVAGPITAPHLVIRATNVAGGREVRVGDSTFLSEWYPAWSPDGDYVRFRGCRLSGCGWFEMGKLGGTVRAIALPPNAESPAWSGDGRVAYVLGDTIFVSRAGDAGSPRRVAVHTVDWPPLHSLAWSPDARLIAYVAGNPVWPSTVNVATCEIWIVSAAGGEPRRVTTGSNLNVSPVWLDARRLLFVSNRDGPRGLYLVEAGPTGALGAPRPVPGVADPHSISFAARSGTLAFAKLALRQNIWSFPLGRAAPVPVHEAVVVTNGNQVIDGPNVSPDGRWIAFYDNVRGTSDLYKMPLPRGEVVSLTQLPGDEFNPRWSPDGRELSFEFWPAADSSDLMVLAADGGQPARLTRRPGGNEWSAWSPNGLAIAFEWWRAGRGTLWLVERDSVGGAWHEARPLADVECNPSDWAPDGSGVLCISTSRAILFLISPAGRVLWRYDLPASNQLVADYWGMPRFSRDGSLIYFAGSHRDGRRGIWAIPARGGPARLAVWFDDPALVAQGGVSVTRERVYATVGQYESDIWVAKLRW